MNGRKIWVLVRVGSLLLIACYAYLSPLPEHRDFLHPAPWKFLLEIGAFALFGVPMVISLSRLAKHSEDLRRPSWFINPLSVMQPLVFFDFGALCVVAYGLGCAATQFWRGPSNWFWEIPVTLGVGAWLGVRMSALGKGTN
jgi:hypothetical protein